MIFCALAGDPFNWSLGIALAAVSAAECVALLLIFAWCVAKHRRQPQEPEQRPIIEAEGNREAEYYNGLDEVQVPEGELIVAENLAERDQVRQLELAAALEALEDADRGGGAHLINIEPNVPDDEVGIPVEVQDRDVGVACGN